MFYQKHNLLSFFLHLNRVFIQKILARDSLKANKDKTCIILLLPIIYLMLTRAYMKVYRKAIFYHILSYIWDSLWKT